uniref:Uncharacterized protein n=1 Tax=Triticum urartu TaxID=4572 RepID=A0A8R7QN66_TRIUA
LSLSLSLTASFSVDQGPAPQAARCSGVPLLISCSWNNCISRNTCCIWFWFPSLPQLHLQNTCITHIHKVLRVHKKGNTAPRTHRRPNSHRTAWAALSPLCVGKLALYHGLSTLFLSLGIIMCLLTCSGHIAAETCNSPCLSCHVIFVFLLVILEAAIAADVFLNRYWEEDKSHQTWL